ncbi:MAG: arsenate reductase (glutaredoxin) [Bacteroidetes bacterium]|nr:arsenate reductase (glutaredoxin) [Bacteroidota bacterium]
MIEMLHHPYCTKSCAALDFVKANELNVTVIDLTVRKPDRPFLIDLLKKLGIPAFELVRTSEPVYRKKFEGKTLSEDEWIDAIVAHPILLQRPVFIDGDKAVIGRPVEKVYDLLK